jgi:hypothetical protein
MDEAEGKSEVASVLQVLCWSGNWRRAAEHTAPRFACGPRLRREGAQITGLARMCCLTS